MEIDAISNDIWESLGKGEKLSNEQEKFIIQQINIGNFEDTQKVVEHLRQTSAYFMEKSYQETVIAVNSLKSFMLFNANEHLETAVQAEWKGAMVNAQANRIDNTIKQQQAIQQALKAIIPVPVTPLKIPPLPPINPNTIRDFPIKLPNMPIYV